MRRLRGLLSPLPIAAALWLGCLDTVAGQNSALLVGPTALSFSYQAGGGVPPAQNLLLLSSDATLSFTVSTSTASGVPWLSANATSGSTPATLSVSASPGSLSVGTHTGSVVIASAGATNSSVTVAVTLTVTASTQLTASPSTLTFHFQLGGSIPATQTVSLSSNGSPLAVTAATSAGTNWLLVGSAAAVTPAAINVGVNPAGLAAGTYNGSITFGAAAATNSPVTVSVVLTVSSSPHLTLSPSSMSFQFQLGGSAPPNQTLSVASSGASVLFQVSTTTASGGPWLVAGTLSGATPASIAIAVNPAGLAPGAYSGSVTLTAAGASNTPLAVPVTLTVSGNPLLNVSARALSFQFQVGGSVPAAQALTLTSSTGTLNYAGVVTASGGAWLAAGPLSGSTTGTVTVAVSPAGLLPGTYAGAITFTAPGAGNSPQTVAVTLTVSNNPLLKLSDTSLSFGFQIGTLVPAVRTISVTSTGAPLSFTASASTAGGANWLVLGAAAATTPGVVTVAVNPAGLAAGSYTGSITFVADGAANSPQTVAVNLVVSASALIVASPGSLSFSSLVGSGGATIQPVSLTSTDGTQLNFTVSTSVAAGGNWLLVGPLSGTTPSNLSITANATGLSVGTYSGSIVITAPGVPNSPQTIAVTLTVTSSATIAVAPAALTFSQSTGGAPPAAQTLTVSATGGSRNFTTTATTSSGGNWLSASITGGVTPASLTVSVNAGALAAGTYSGSITIISEGAANSPQIIPVTLTVGVALELSPSSLAFQFQAGGVIPAPQSVSLSAGGGANVVFTASANVAGPINWLSVSPTTATTPATLFVSVNPTSLAPGTYNGFISIAATAVNSPQTISVSLVVGARPATPFVGGVVNAASFLPTAVSAGEIVTLFGANLGPSPGITLRLTAAGRVATSLGDTQVLFDGILAPIVYVSETQLSVIVPYNIAGRFSTRLVVDRLGQQSNIVELRVADTAPGIFTVEASGSGQGAILNQNLSVNSVGNRAARGSVVAIFATGEGQTTPGGIDGFITGELLRRPVAQVLVTIGGQQALVEYAGAAPTLVSGVLQVNARIPDSVAAGAAVPVVLTIAGVSSQLGVTLAVQ